MLYDVCTSIRTYIQGGRPVGPGSFHLPSGITQHGEYVLPKSSSAAAAAEEEEGQEAAASAAAGTPSWVGIPVVVV